MSRIEEQQLAEVLTVVREGILRHAAQTTYDHRLHLPKAIAETFPHLLDDHQLLYSRLRLAVARFLAPRTICEIGVGWGISAKAFRAGKPGVFYVGIDNGEMGLDPRDALVDESGALPSNVRFSRQDSRSIDDFSAPFGPLDLQVRPLDLVHLDGGHGREQKSSDVVKAVLSNAQWLLCDDAHDPMVAAGIFDGLYQAWKGTIPMIYFENSHSGSLLIHSGALADRKDW